MSLMILEETEAKELSLRFSPLKLNRNVSRWMEKNTIFFFFFVSSSSRAGFSSYLSAVVQERKGMWRQTDTVGSKMM